MKKIYCKDCKFNQGWRECCQPFVHVGIRILDFYSPNHLIRKKKWEMMYKEERNKNNNCKPYKRKWWKVWV